MKTRTLNLSLLPIVLMASGCNQLKPASPEARTEAAASKKIASAEVLNPEGTAIGTAGLVSHDEQYSLNVSLRQLPDGEKALHIHTTGACDGPDFKSAGGHLNPFGAAHGSESDNGAHLGDLPNMVVGADGTAEVSIILPKTDSPLLPLIFDDDGAAIMVHAGPDDYKSDPAGAAGPRIACGVLKLEIS